MKTSNNRMIKIILMFFALLIVVPVVWMIIWAFTERWAWPDILPQVFSFRAVEGILRKSTRLGQMMLSSVFISLAVAALAVVIGTMTARALVLYQFKGRDVLYFCSILPFMVPVTVFAMGIQVTFIKLGWNNTVWGVICAHLVCSLPYAVRLLMDGTEALGDGLEEQARVLGASEGQAFFRVTLPLLVPVLLSAFSMAYIVSFSQYFLTLLIGGGQVKTFTIVMVPYLQGGDRNIACVYSVIFLGITLVLFGIFEWTAGKVSKNNSTEFYS